MREGSRAERIGRDMMDLLFPRKCPFCRKVTGRELMCAACRKEQMDSREQTVREGTFGRCASPLWYEGRAREAILRFKFGGQLSSLDCFGSLMAECAAAQFAGEFEAVTWVPISAKRLKKRGFDQARCLAESVCRLWQVPPIETLTKTFDNPEQSGLDTAEARRANVLGVYETVQPERICGRRLLLVDDIITTGATLTECARVLREAGAAEVLCLTLAAVRGEDE